MWQSYILH